MAVTELAPKTTSGTTADAVVAQPVPLVEAKNLALRIPIFKANDRSIKISPLRLLTDLYFGRTKRAVATLLEDVSFKVHHGERLGLIGSNGAGKSTLLRVLAGIYTPSGGKLTVRGSAKGLFDVSMGMLQDATGLENIYMRGLQMGLNFDEIKELIPGIVEFTELDDAIEKPFNTYSSGMRLRLAVSISTMVEPDILLLDEWLGAGDARFSTKVQDRMNALVEKSRGLVIATHNENLMRNLCTHGLVLSKGKVLYCGELDEALAVYKDHGEQDAPAKLDGRQRGASAG